MVEDPYRFTQIERELDLFQQLSLNRLTVEVNDPTNTAHDRLEIEFWRLV